MQDWYSSSILFVLAKGKARDFLSNFWRPSQPAKFKEEGKKPFLEGIHPKEVGCLVKMMYLFLSGRVVRKIEDVLSVLGFDLARLQVFAGLQVILYDSDR